MSVIADVADAVVTELNEHDFGVAFTSVRTWLPEYKRQELSTLKVFVVPATKETELRGHESFTKKVEIDVAVAAPVDPTSNSAVDAYVDLLELIDTFLTTRALSTYATARWQPKNEPIQGTEGGYSPEMLEKNHMYLGGIRVTYRIC